MSGSVVRVWVSACMGVCGYVSVWGSGYVSVWVCECVGMLGCGCNDIEKI